MLAVFQASVIKIKHPEEKKRTEISVTGYIQQAEVADTVFQIPLG